MWTSDVLHAERTLSDPAMQRFYDNNTAFSENYLKKAKLLESNVRRYRETRKIVPENICKIVLKLTHACNMRCEMCFQWRETGLDSQATVGFHRTVKRSSIAIEDCGHLFAFLENHPCDIVLTGGEPMVHRDFGKYIEKLVELGCFIYICTNGSLIERHYDLLRKYHDRLAFLISIDGPRAVHDAIRGQGFFDITLKAVERMALAKQTGARWIIGIEATMMDKNLALIDDIIGIGEAAGADWMVFNHLWIVNQQARTEYAAYCETRGIAPPYAFDGYDVGNFSAAYVARVTAAVASARARRNTIPVYQNPAFNDVEIGKYYSGALAPRNGYPKMGVKLDVNIDGAVVLSKQFPEIAFGNIVDTPIGDILGSSEYGAMASRMTDHPFGILNACPDLHNLRVA